MKDKYWISEHKGLRIDQRDALNDYLSSLKTANLSARTIERYRWILEKFLVDNPKFLNELKCEDVWDWVRTKYSDVTVGTRNNILSALSMFFKYCEEEGYINHALVKRYWRGRRPKSIPRFLSQKELAQVRLAAEKLALRDQTIVEFFISSGCRLGEVVGLNVSDVDLKNHTVQVTGKGRKVRFVHFSETCAILLRKYLASHALDEPALFVSRKGPRKGTRLKHLSIELMVHKLGQSAGLSRPLTPHCFRHTFATHLLSKGADMNLISELLGHENLNITRIYARTLPEQVTRLYHRYMG